MYKWIDLSSMSDLGKLSECILPEYGPTEVAARLVGGISGAVKSVLVEKNYVDKDYRSTYYSFYAKQGQRYRSDCVRLHFFDQTVRFDPKTLRLDCAEKPLSDHYFGYMILRPTGIATIGRTVLSPDIRSRVSKFMIAADHKVHLLGYTLVARGFPSMDQHIDIAVCAHVACWSILRHYSECYAGYREFLTHDITLMAHEFNPGGLIPSRGLQISDAERVFQAAGTFPVHVARAMKPNVDRSFYRQLNAYLESGFPLFAAMSDLRHAVAIVGYRRRSPAGIAAPGMRYAWDEVESLEVVDDNHLPYLSVPVAAGTSATYSAEDIDAFIVPLPEKIFYPAEAIERLAPALFTLGGTVSLPPKDQTVIRYFVTTGSALRRFVRSRESEFDPRLLEIIMTLPFAQFVWIIEFATEAQWAVGQVAARAVVDATASILEDLPLWLFHNTVEAAVFDRETVGRGLDGGSGEFKLSSMGHSGFTRMDQNLRPTQPK